MGHLAWPSVGGLAPRHPKPRRWGPRKPRGALTYSELLPEDSLLAEGGAVPASEAELVLALVDAHLRPLPNHDDGIGPALADGTLPRGQARDRSGLPPGVPSPSISLRTLVPKGARLLIAMVIRGWVFSPISPNSRDAQHPPRASQGQTLEGHVFLATPPRPRTPASSLKEVWSAGPRPTPGSLRSRDREAPAHLPAEQREAALLRAR